MHYKYGSCLSFNINVISDALMSNPYSNSGLRSRETLIIARNTCLCLPNHSKGIVSNFLFNELSLLTHFELWTLSRCNISQSVRLIESRTFIKNKVNVLTFSSWSIIWCRPRYKPYTMYIVYTYQVNENVDVMKHRSWK